MTIAAGTKPGRYQVTSQLGAGGMGEVYLTADTKLDRKVALKICPQTLPRSTDHIKFFSYSSDGKQLALSRGNRTRDALMIHDEGK